MFQQYMGQYDIIQPLHPTSWKHAPDDSTELYSPTQSARLAALADYGNVISMAVHLANGKTKPNEEYQLPLGEKLAYL